MYIDATSFFIRINLWLLYLEKEMAWMLTVFYFVKLTRSQRHVLIKLFIPKRRNLKKKKEKEKEMLMKAW